MSTAIQTPAAAVATPAAANPMEALAAFLTTGAGANMDIATKKAMAVAAVRSSTRVYVMEPGSKGAPSVASDGITKNYAEQRMVAIAFGKGSDASGKTIICRPAKMRELLANSAALLAACDQCEKLDAKS